jgi:hypothetical protein
MTVVVTNNVILHVKLELQVTLSIKTIKQFKGAILRCLVAGVELLND